MEEKKFPGAVSLFGDDSTCICGNYECNNHQNAVPVEDLSNQPDEHELTLHVALERIDCATACKLLCSGMKLCYLGAESCLSLIVKHWTPASLNSVLKLFPSAMNYRGPKGETLLMICQAPDKFQTVLNHGADVNAKNDDGENILLYNFKHFLSQQVQSEIRKLICLYEHDHELQDIKMENLVQIYKDILEMILNSGLDLDAEDNDGQTALEILLQMFKPGYVFEQNHCCPPNNKCDLFKHHTKVCLCEYGNKVASTLLSVLLEAGAELPSSDQHGRTPLMFTVQSPWNFKNVQTLIERGVDINTMDIYGKNAIHYLLASTVQHIQIASDCGCLFEIPVVDQMVSFLLDHGCHMQGIDLIMDDDDGRYKIVNYLMAEETSSLRERAFSQKLETKNDPTNLSFLSLYLNARDRDPFDEEMKFKSSDVSFIEQEIADGLDVNCGAKYEVDLDEEKNWEEILSLPYPLMHTMNCKLQYYSHVLMDGESDDEDEILKVVEERREHYQAVEDIQKLLLPFWPHPPLALLLFDKIRKNELRSVLDESNQDIQIMLRKRQIQFLCEVGGPLSPGSEIYHAVKKTLESNAKELPPRGELIPLFDHLHSEVPSLRQLSRTVLRSSLKKTDTKGLDVSSLRVLCQDEMIPLPPDIVDLINFKKSSVSEMEVVEEMIEFL